VKFTFDVDAAGAAANLTGVAEHALNMAPPFAIIAKLLEGGRAANAASAGAYYGDSWPSLAESTAQRKSRQGLPNELMVGTGALKTALEGGEGALARITPTTITVGVEGSLFYARFHEAGTDAMPTRTVIAIRPEDEAAAVGIIHEWIDRGIA
jgi:hypothetical protein